MIVEFINAANGQILLTKDVPHRPTVGMKVRFDGGVMVVSDVCEIDGRIRAELEMDMH